MKRGLHLFGILIVFVFLINGAFASTNVTILHGYNSSSGNFDPVHINPDGSLKTDLNSSDFWDGLDVPDDIQYSDLLNDFWNSNVQIGNNNFSINTSSLFVNTNTGNVGIGTSSPSSKLEIQGDGSVFDIQNSTGTSKFFVNSTSGSVGIGTSSPALNNGTSNGFLEIESDSNPFLLLENTLTDNQWGIFVDNAAGDFNIWHSNTNIKRFTIDTSGNVGIGTSSPGRKLDVAGDVNIEGTDFRLLQVTSTANNKVPFEVQQTGATITGTVLMDLEFPDASNPSNFYIRFRDSGGNVGSIDGDGAGGVNFNTASDIRFKENIVNLSEYYEGKLPDISKINPISYTGKNESEDSMRNIGFSAQEIYGLFGEEGPASYDNETDRYFLSYERMSVLNTQYIKELKSENEKLRQRTSEICQKLPEYNWSWC